MLRRRVIAGLLAADVLLFGGWVGALQWSRRGATYRLPVEGYDPRDLLSGHYVRFRLVAEREADSLAGAERQQLAAQGARASFCLEERAGLLHVSRRRGPDDECKPFLTGQWLGGRLQFGAERFYVDERSASRVTVVRAGAETYVVATIDDGGVLGLKDLVVDGKSVRAR